MEIFELNVHTKIIKATDQCDVLQMAKVIERQENSLY